jgi:hypothetical protein
MTMGTRVPQSSFASVAPNLQPFLGIDAPQLYG